MPEHSESDILTRLVRARLRLAALREMYYAIPDPSPSDREIYVTLRSAMLFGCTHARLLRSEA